MQRETVACLAVGVALINAVGIIAIIVVGSLWMSDQTQNSAIIAVSIGLGVLGAMMFGALLVAYQHIVPLAPVVVNDPLYV